ncbi:MAG: hypothetical protein Q8N21_01370 [bacterium]|nr:hypothetical protein [bacterium]
MNYQVITAWTGLTTAIVAIYALWAESRRHRFSTGIDLILRLEDQFSTQRMYVNRRKVARAFQNKNYVEAMNEIDEIIDFFEGVGFFVKRGALDRKVVWTFFFSYLFRFRHFAKEYIENEQSRDPTLWTEFVDLYNNLLQIERADRRNRKSSLEISEDDLEQFLREETNLAVSENVLPFT